MKKLQLILLFAIFSLSAIYAQNTPAPYGAIPNDRQMKYLQEPLAAFIHFGINTFTGADGIEWGNMEKIPAAQFNPIGGNIDTDQWVRLFKKAGFKRIIVVMKHHDGFCNWPTAETDYNISNSPYRNGKGDLAQQVSLSCDKYGMDMGVYLSPWDAHEPSYGDATPGDYNQFYKNQLRELLGGKYGRLNPATGKREIAEIWLDGASSTTNKQSYDLDGFYNLVRELQPNCCVWMDGKWHYDQNGNRTKYNLDAMWVGNEAGYIDDPAWNKLDLSEVKKGKIGRSATGSIFCVSEADVSIRPGWFYHKSQNSSVKSLDKLVNGIFYRTVGMGIPLLLNIPPDRSGRIHENDSVALMQFANAISNTYKTNLLNEKMSATATQFRGAGYEPKNVLNANYNSFWTMKDGEKSGSITINLDREKYIDVVKIMEYIPLGQRISKFKVEVKAFGEWMLFGEGQTVGYQRHVRGRLLPVTAIRLTVEDSMDVPIISSIEAYRTDSTITELGKIPVGIVSHSLVSANENLKLNSKWVRVVGTKTPQSGKVKIYINGKKVFSLNANSAKVQNDVIFYQSKNNSAETIKNLKLKSSCGKGLVLQGIYTFENGIRSMFELATSSASVDEGAGLYSFTINRLGDTSQPARVKITTSPGTGVHGKVYMDKVEFVEFGAGENSKTAHVNIVENNNSEGDKDFYVEISEPSAENILGFTTKTKVLVRDND